MNKNNYENVYTLTPAEKEVYDALESGLTAEQISRMFGKSLRAVKSQITTIREKLRCQ